MPLRSISRPAVVLGAFALVLATAAHAQQPPPPVPTPPTTPTTPIAKPPASPRPVDDGPMVLSVEAAARLRGRRPDGPVDRYGRGEPDWASIPPWRQASFYGLRAEGQVFIFVVDCSGSMADEDRLDRAKRELRRSVAGLREPQRFNVIFYNDRVRPMGDTPRPPDSANRAALGGWLDRVDADGGTDPRGALKLALALRPDAVFLLSDGAFPAGTVEAAALANDPGRKVPIHCVDLANGTAGNDLRRIAEQSGGRYATAGR